MKPRFELETIPAREGEIYVSNGTCSQSIGNVMYPVFIDEEEEQLFETIAIKNIGVDRCLAISIT